LTYLAYKKAQGQNGAKPVKDNRLNVDLSHSQSLAN